MAYTWLPSIYRTDKTPNTYKLPQPILKCDIIRQAMSKEFNIPLKGTKDTYGLTNNNRIIQMSGAQDRDVQNGASVQSEETNWLLMEKFDSYCAQYNIDPGGGFELFLVYDASGAGTYRKFKDVVCVEFKFDPGDDNLLAFSWSASFIARDPVIYTTAPGA